MTVTMAMAMAMAMVISTRRVRSRESRARVYKRGVVYMRLEWGGRANRIDGAIAVGRRARAWFWLGPHSGGGGPVSRGAQGSLPALRIDFCAGGYQPQREVSQNPICLERLTPVRDQHYVDVIALGQCDFVFS